MNLILYFLVRTQRQEFGELLSGIFWPKSRVLDTVIIQNSIADYGKGRQTTAQWLHLASERGLRRDIIFVFI
jgi:hypothetical protein